MSRLTGRTARLEAALLILACAWLVGCGKSESTVDAAPVEHSISQLPIYDLYVAEEDGSLTCFGRR